MLKKKARLKGGTLVGDVVLIDRESVRPNTWNPNEMTPEIRAALRYDFEHTGWLASQAMTVWATDERGKKQNLIIDGEHRWEIAGEFKMKKVPAVLLHGLTEAQAKALTVKLGRRRGKFNTARLSDVVRDLKRDAELSTDLGLTLGYSDAELAAFADVAAPPTSSITPPTVSRSNVRMIPLYYSADQHVEFESLVAALGKRWKCDNVTDTVARAVKESLR